MPKTLQFHTFAEKAPEHGQEIFYFRSRLGGFIEPKFATIQCSWVEYDEDGKATGDSWSYECDKAELPDNCRLEFSTNEGAQLRKQDYWCSCSCVDEMVNEP